jgi:hypothetical protein
LVFWLRSSTKNYCIAKEIIAIKNDIKQNGRSLQAIHQTKDYYPEYIKNFQKLNAKRAKIIQLINAQMI